MRKNTLLKLSALFLVMVLAFGFTACKKDKADDLPKALTLSSSSATLKAGSDTVKKISVSVTNINSSDIKWSSSNPSVAGITVEADNLSVTIRGISEGTAEITVSAAGLVDRCAVTVTEADNLTVLNPAIELVEGSSAKINYSTNLDEITFSIISGADVVRLDNSSGNFTALKIGTATIEVKAGSVTKQVTVTVRALNIKLNQSTLSMFEGEEYSLEAQTFPNGEKVEFTSSDTSIVTVDKDSGKVTAVSIGSATITATMTAHEGISATCEVTVTEDVFEVKITASQATELYPAQTVQLSATVYSMKNKDFISDAQITWEIIPSDSNLITLDENALVTANSAYGTATVKAVFTYSDAQYSAEIEIKVIKESTDGIEVSTKTELIDALSDAGNLDKKIYIFSDIDMDGEILEVFVNGTFNGTLDGRGHKIYNFTITKFFDHIGANGIIKNLAIECDAAMAAHRGIFGENQGGKIQNCLLDVTITEIDGAPHAGVISTYNSGTVENTIIFVRHELEEVHISADFTQPAPAWAEEAETKNLLYCSFGSTVMSNGAVAMTEQQLQTASSFSDDWDRSIWNIADGEMPSLIKA